MPTPKRERQRAARAAKRAALEAARRRRRNRIRGGGAVVVAIAVVGIVYAVYGGGHPKRVAAPKPGPTTTTTAAPVAAPCPPVTGAPTRRVNFSLPPPSCIDPTTAYTAKVTTDAGSFTIALAKSDPVVVNDFVYLARYGLYKGLLFTRVIPGAVVQGGDPNPLGTSQGPGYTVRGTVPKAGAYRIGTVAMARTASQPAGAAGSQFFVVVGPAGTRLPPLYSVLGQVTSGMKVLDAIAASGSASGVPKVDHYIISVTISPSRAQPAGRL